MNFKSQQIPTDILDYLPYGISIQDKKRNVIYENRIIKEWFGTFYGRKCYERWEYWKEEVEPCSDCPGHVSFIDGKPHFVVRKIKTKMGEYRYVRISHYPLIEDENQKFIEVIRDITTEVFAIEERLELHYDWRSDLYLGFLDFNLITENSIIKSSKLPFIQQLGGMEAFYEVQQIFWHVIFEKTELYELLGPIPLIDVMDYVAYLYNFKIETEEAMYTLVLMLPRYLQVSTITGELETVLKNYIVGLKQSPNAIAVINLEYLKQLICSVIC